MRNEDNYWLRRASSGRFTRRRFVGGAALAGVGAASLGLVGCGDDDSGGTTPTSAPSGTTPAASASAAAASPTAAASAAVDGGVYVGAWLGGNVFDSVDVHRAFGDPTSWLSNYIINKVVRYKNPDTGEVEGDLAAKLPESPDLSTYIFTLRKDVKWQQTPLTNGRGLTSADIKWHFDRQANAKTKDGVDTPFRFSAVYKGIKVETPDDYTAKITLAKPSGGFLTQLSGYFSTVPNREATEKFEGDHRTLTEEAMPASHDFILKQWRAGKPINLARNPANSRKGQPHFDGLIYPTGIFEDPVAYRTAFEQKQVDAWGSPDASVTKAVLDAHKDTMSETLTGVGNTVFMHLNMNKQFKDVRLVQAMNQAFDRRAMIQTFHQGLGQVSGPVTWLQEGYAVKPDDLIKYAGYKTDRAAEMKDARALWAAGGGPALGDVDIKIPDTWLGPWPDTTQIIPKMLNDALGVTQFKSTKTTYNEEIIPNLSNGNFPNWFAWTSQVNSPDPRTDLFNTYNSTSPSNFQHVNNPDIDKLTVDALGTTDYNKGRDAALQVQDILLKNGMFGNVVLYNYISRGAYWNYVHPNLKTYPTAGKPGAGYNIFAGFLTGVNAWLNLKDPSATGRPAQTV